MPWLAALLTILLPGLGHLYLGRGRQAVAAYCGAAGILLLGFCVTFATLTGLRLTLAGEGLWVGAAAAHAWVQAGRGPQASHRWFTRWPAVSAIALVACLTTTCGAPRIALHLTRYRVCDGDSASMAPTLAPGDFSVVDVGYYRRHPVQRQDLIFFDAPEAGGLQYWIKRCVALEGDVVEVRDGVFYLNGQPEPDGPWRRGPAGRSGPRADPGRYGPMIVPEGCVFCLGDNRGDSYDSRYWGPLQRSSIQGKVLYSFWPANRVAQDAPKPASRLRARIPVGAGASTGPAPDRSGPPPCHCA